MLAETGAGSKEQHDTTDVLGAASRGRCREDGRSGGWRGRESSQQISQRRNLP
jgi:hypothetical protein